MAAAESAIPQRLDALGKNDAFYILCFIREEVFSLMYSFSARATGAAAKIKSMRSVKSGFLS